MNEARILRLFKSNAWWKYYNFQDIIYIHRDRKLHGLDTKRRYIKSFGIIKGAAVNAYLNKVIKQYE